MEDYQITRNLFMKTIAQEITAMSGENHVLKGGAALLLGYNSPRFTQDMDFDAKKAINLEEPIRRAAEKIGLTINKITLKKDTETTQRYMVDYGETRPNGPNPLKVECSFRRREISLDRNIIESDGMRIYGIETIAMQKAELIIKRDAPRDIADLHYISKEFPAAFDKDSLMRIQEGLAEKGLTYLATIFEKEKAFDEELSNLDPERIILELDQQVKTLLAEREREGNVMATERTAGSETDKQRDVDRREKREEPGKNTQEIDGVKITADQTILQKDIQTLTLQAKEEWAKNGKTLTHLDLSRDEKTREITMIGAEKEMTRQQEQQRAKEITDRDRAEKAKNNEIQKQKEEKENTIPAVKDLPKNAHSYIRYLAYAKEARIQGCIKDTDKAIATAMAKNGERAQTITETIKHSPAYLTHDDAQKHQKARQLTQAVLKEPSLQHQKDKTKEKSRSLER